MASGTRYAPEPQTKHGGTLDLLVTVATEDSLAEALKAHGCDIYVGGPYDTLGDRLGACIVRNGMQAVLVGRGLDGKPETYAACFERLYGKALPSLAPKNIAGGQHDTRTTKKQRVPPVDRASDAAEAGGAIGGTASS